MHVEDYSKSWQFCKCHLNFVILCSCKGSCTRFQRKKEDLQWRWLKPDYMMTPESCKHKPPQCNPVERFFRKMTVVWEEMIYFKHHFLFFKTVDFYTCTFHIIDSMVIWLTLLVLWWFYLAWIVKYVREGCTYRTMYVYTLLFMTSPELSSSWSFCCYVCPHCLFLHHFF